MPREVVEASVYWGGELFAVKYFTFGQRVLFDDVPSAPNIEVRTRIVEAGPRMRRNGWDLPYGAIALAATLCQSLVVASIGGVSQPQKHDLGRGESLAVTAEPALPGELVGPMTSPIHGGYEAPENDAEPEGGGPDRAPTREELGTFGMVGLLAQYRGVGDASSPWAGLQLHADSEMWGDAIGDVRGIGGIALSGVGEGGGGVALGSVALDRVHTTAGAMGAGYGSAHGHLTGRHANIIRCRLSTEVVTCNRIPPEIIQRVVRQSEGRFRACYLEGLQRNPQLAGRVTTRFVIARDGTVAAAADGGSDLPDAEVLSCVQRAFTSLEFPVTPGIATVVYPIVMQPE